MYVRLKLEMPACERNAINLKATENKTTGGKNAYLIALKNKLKKFVKALERHKLCSISFKT
jgi:hypothetical protein